MSRIANSKHQNPGHGYAPKLLPPPSVDYSLVRTLLRAICGMCLFPRKIPRGLITSPPVQVKEVWGEYNHYRKPGAYGSLIVHVMGLALLIAGTMLGRQKPQPARPQPERSYW